MSRRTGSASSARSSTENPLARSDPGEARTVTGEEDSPSFSRILEISGFWGEDLFEDYTHWFVETMRAACANPELEWVVKLHPAHLVKAKQNKDSGRPSELEVIDSAVGALPPHVKLLYPDTDLSTYSLFEIADYGVTVRGTVGVECALFGIPVVTAGTGRYYRRGFTLDSSTREEYLYKLATLQSYPRLSAEQVEIAERYVFGALFVVRCRCPLPRSSLSATGLRRRRSPFIARLAATGWNRRTCGCWRIGSATASRKT